MMFYGFGGCLHCLYNKSWLWLFHVLCGAFSSGALTDAHAAWITKTSNEQYLFIQYTMWGPPVISWFINPINYCYKYNKP